MERNTVQRKIIFNSLMMLNTHPTIEEIYTEIQKEHQSISKTTVYRHLRQLANSGVIQEISLLDGLARYDRSTRYHSHFKCKKCNSIFDVEIKDTAEIKEAVQDKYGFQIEKHDIVFTGVCLQCKSLNNY